MAENYIIQYRDERSNKLYPVTLASAVIADNGKTLEGIQKDLELKIHSIEDEAATLLTKVQELSAKVDILCGDKDTEGSVDNKIANALDWEVLSK